MATWKKVAVSGSNVSQFNNDAGYLTSVTAQTAFVTASFDGINLIADSSQGQLNFASSSGQGLTISANSGTDTLTFGLSSIPNSSLQNSTISGVSLGGTLTALTAGSGLSSPGTYTGATARTFTVDSGSLVSYFNSSSYAGVSGDILIDGSGIATIQPNSVALGTDTTGDYVANLGAGTGVTIGSNTGEGSAPTISVNYGSTSNTAVQGNTTITVNGTVNAIDITGTAAQALGGAPSYTIDLSNTIDGNRTFTNNVTVGGDLVVQGTASFQNTENLLVADRFVLFASGSNATGDGGIVVQQDTQNIGELFGYDSGTTRWAVDSAFNATLSTFTPEAFMAAVVEGAGTDPDAAPARYDAKGNIFIGTDEGIWIYS